MSTAQATEKSSMQASRPLVGWALHDGWAVAKRDLLKIARVPESWFFSIVQPIIFVLLFAFVLCTVAPKIRIYL